MACSHITPFGLKVKKFSMLAIVCLLIVIVWGLAVVQVTIFCKQKYETATGLPDNNVTNDTSYHCNNDTSSSSSLNTSKNCNDDFYCEQNKGYCVPDCYKWTSSSISTYVSIFIFSGIGILTSILALVLSCIRYKKIMKFPSALLGYMMITTLITSLTILISASISEKYTCPSRDLENVATTSAPHCILLGLIQVYSGLQLLVWWLIYIVVIFFMLYFPFKSQVYLQSKKGRYLHIICILMGLALPLYSVVLGGINPDVFQCVSFPFMVFEEQYYVYYLPLIFILCVGSTLLLLIYWQLYYQQQQNNHSDLGTPKAKIILATSFGLVYQFIAMIRLIYYTLIYTDLQQDFEEYLRCERSGLRTCSKATTPFDQFLSIVINLLHGIIPIIIIIYMTNFQYLRSACNRLAASSV